MESLWNLNNVISIAKNKSNTKEEHIENRKRIIKDFFKESGESLNRVVYKITQKDIAKMIYSIMDTAFIENINERDFFLICREIDETIMEADVDLVKLGMKNYIIEMLIEMGLMNEDQMKLAIEKFIVDLKIGLKTVDVKDKQ